MITPCFIHFFVLQALDISEFMYGRDAEVGNQDPVEVWERIGVVKSNMGLTAAWMEENLNILVSNQQKLIDEITAVPEGRRRHLLTSTDHRMTSSADDGIFPLGNGSHSILSKPFGGKVEDVNIMNPKPSVNSKKNEANNCVNQMKVLKSDITRRVDKTRKDMDMAKEEMKKEVDAMKGEIKKEMNAMKAEIKKEIEIVLETLTQIQT